MLLPKQHVIAGVPTHGQNTLSFFVQSSSGSETHGQKQSARQIVYPRDPSHENPSTNPFPQQHDWSHNKCEVREIQNAPFTQI